MLLAIVCNTLLPKYITSINYFSYNLTKDTLFILVSGILLKYLLYSNDLKNAAVFNKLKNSNDEIKKSNERYDIVTKATSDTIWDWKIQEDNFYGIKELKMFLDTNKIK